MVASVLEKECFSITDLSRNWFTHASTRDLNLSYGHTSRHIPFQLMLHYYIVNKIPDSQKRVIG